MRKIILEQQLGVADTKKDNTRTITQSLTDKDYFDILQTSCGYAKDYTYQVPSGGSGKHGLIKNYGAKGYIKIEVDANGSFKFLKYKPNTTTPYEEGTLQSCDAIKGKITAPMGKDMITAANAIINGDASLFGLSSDNREKIIGGLANGTFTPVDLNTLNGSIFKPANVYFVYKQTGVQGTKSNIPDIVNQQIEKLGYTFNQPTDADGFKKGRKLGEIDATMVSNPEIKKHFPNQNIGNIIVYPLPGKEGANAQVSTQSLNAVIANTKKIINNKIDKDTCRDGIRMLYKLKTCQDKSKGNCASLLQQFSGGQLEQLKSGVYQCVSQGSKFRNVLGIVQLKDKVEDLLNDNGPYGLYQQKENVRQRTMNESYDNHLKKLVKSHLTTLSESKKKTLTEDDNAIKDTLSSVFSYGLGGGINTIKEKFAENIIDRLVKGGSDTWIGGVLSKAFGTIPIGDYLNGKVYHCDYLTKIIALSIANEAVDKLQDKAGLTGGIFDVIRNSMMSAVNKESEFVNHLTKGLSKVICPILGDVQEIVTSLFKDKLTK